MCATLSGLPCRSSACPLPSLPRLVILTKCLPPTHTGRPAACGAVQRLAPGAGLPCRCAAGPPAHAAGAVHKPPGMACCAKKLCAVPVSHCGMYGCIRLQVQFQHGVRAEARGPAASLRGPARCGWRALCCCVLRLLGARPPRAHALVRTHLCCADARALHCEDRVVPQPHVPLSTSVPRGRDDPATCRTCWSAPCRWRRCGWSARTRS